MLIDRLVQWDKGLLIVLNGFHTPWLDPVMLLMTHTLFWFPLYAFIIYLLFRTFKNQAWYLLIGMSLTILLCDQLTAELIKPYFARLRPSHDLSMTGILHLVQGYTADRYGFSSGHAANTFGVALFAWFTFRSIYKWIALVFVWAGLMTYTRIYLGVHFPADILAGVILGLCCGAIGIATSHYLGRWLSPAKEVA
jgi:undecaprenyl-diphosphatase